MKKMMIASTSTVYGSEFLDYLQEVITELFVATKEILFIPYARPGGISHDDYTAGAAKAFSTLDKKIVGIHTFNDPVKALHEAKGVFTGGGNTFVLVSQLYKNRVMQPLREVIFNGMPYLGTSAGSNICGVTMQTTNDMPIVYPPSFKTLGVVPFNINPHYLDTPTDSTHMGETRETRIKEFHTQNTLPVIGLREGSWLQVNGNDIVLMGPHSARVFEQQKEPYEVEPSSLITLM
jgi:dipeptidase E